MEFLQPRSLAEAIAAEAEYPAAVPIAGGTDVMVEINFDARRPEALLDLNRVSELGSWQQDDGLVRLGAEVTYTRLIAELGGLLPGLAMAARAAGSPLFVLRERLARPGSKNTCEQDECGSCTILLDAGAVQCGFCTPGRLVQARWFLQQSLRRGTGGLPSDLGIREALAGKILDAVRLAAARMAGDAA
jgi:xanthine dehydrogenase iron-sulfur cluster and FAD-binding subunit A